MCIRDSSDSASDSPDSGDAAKHLGVRFFDPAQVAAETILVELLVRGRVPEAAGVRRDLVTQADGPRGVLSELQLEIDQGKISLQEEGCKNAVHPLRQHRRGSQVVG